MELILTDKGRVALESEDLEDNLDTWLGRWLIGIEQGVIGSGDHSFSNWDEFKVWYGEFGYKLTGKLLKGGYITVIGDTEEEEVNEDVPSYLAGLIGRKKVAEERRRALEPEQEDTAAYLSRMRRQK